MTNKSILVNDIFLTSGINIIITYTLLLYLLNFSKMFILNIFEKI